MRARVILPVALAVLLAGCATRGPIAFKCAGADHPDPKQRTFYVLPPSPLVEDIQSGARETGVEGPSPAQVTSALVSDPGDPIARAFDRAFGRAVDSSVRAAAPAPVETLLLSGGGQWGAFGAGFLWALHDAGHWPDPMVVTGVSTGALQALLVTAEPAQLAANLEQLEARYTLQREREVARRGPMALAVLTGSIADIAPLRRRIEATLCVDGQSERGCPLIKSLASAHRAGRSALIGMVSADKGEFIVADATRIAAEADPADPKSLRAAQQCLTAAAMASLAMPAFFRQVTINERTYYDGGVRLSVYEDAVAARARAEDARRGNGSPVVRMTVIRNGPTVAARLDDPPGKGINDRQDALDLGLRAYALIVNTLEVDSIAALRLAHPWAPLRLATADGWDKSMPDRPACVRREGPLFDPVFMQCLMRLGREKGRAAAFTNVRPLPEPKP